MKIMIGPFHRRNLIRHENFDDDEFKKID